MNLVERKMFKRQLSGVWLDHDQPMPPRLMHAPTGAVLPRLDETDLIDFICLDLVRVLAEVGSDFIWLPLSHVERRAYAHTLGLIYNEPWRLVVHDPGDVVQEYDATYAELLPSERVGDCYGNAAALKVRKDDLVVQLRLCRRTRS